MPMWRNRCEVFVSVTVHWWLFGPHIGLVVVKVKVAEHGVVCQTARWVRVDCAGAACHQPFQRRLDTYRLNRIERSSQQVRCSATVLYGAVARFCQPVAGVVLVLQLHQHFHAVPKATCADLMPKRFDVPTMYILQCAHHLVLSELCGFV